MSELETAALEAMRARGIGNAGELITFATPDAILATCRWWDRQQGVGAGLLAKRIRDGGVPTDEVPEPTSVVDLKQRELHRRFKRHVEQRPVGSVIETHLQVLSRTPNWCAENEHDEQCCGRMIVLSADYPVIDTECDRCGEHWGYPLATLNTMPARPGGLAERRVNLTINPSLRVVA